MTEQTDLAVTDEQLPAAPEAVAPAPTIEQMLSLAINRGVDPAVLERLVGLHERITAQRAEQAFNAALLAFRSECPAIIKNAEAVDKNHKVLYRFIDLSELTKTVDQLLFKRGLSYTWDTDMDGERTVVTCWIHHVAGHKRSAKFTAKGSGTSIMSPAQISASVVTFGRRQSLLCALGLTPDLDDDARRPPMPRPDADPNAPHVLTRGERQKAREVAPDDGTPRVSAGALNDLLEEWREGNQNGGLPQFAAWAAGVLKTDADMTKVGNWTVDSLSVCREAL